MTTIQFKIVLLGFLLTFIGIANAQKVGIVIDENLTANSEPLKVKMGTQWMGKIWNIKFGDYEVVESKMGWIKTCSKSNLINTKSESETTEKFSFTLSNKTGDSARVNAANNIKIKVLQETELFPFLIIGENELLLDSSNFTALININQDTTETWTLFMNVIVGSTVEDGGTAFLTNGSRKILIISASSINSKGAFARMLPAQGYEFFENDQAICALQYFGGGNLGMNKNIVWIQNKLDPKMKLILAAAMTSVLQLTN